MRLGGRYLVIAAVAVIALAGCDDAGDTASTTLATTTSSSTSMSTTATTATTTTTTTTTTVALEPVEFAGCAARELLDPPSSGGSGDVDLDGDGVDDARLRFVGAGFPVQIQLTIGDRLLAEAE